MGPAKFEFGSDPGGAGECLRAVLDYVHLGGGRDTRFAWFGCHPCLKGGGGELSLSLWSRLEKVVVVGGERL